VQLAVFEVGRDPLVQLLDEPRLALPDADGKIEVGDRDLRLEWAGRVLDADLVDDRGRARDAVVLPRDGSRDHRRVIVVARDLQVPFFHVAEGRVLRRAARDRDWRTLQVAPILYRKGLEAADHRLQGRIRLREVDHLRALGRDRE